ncbi:MULTISPECIES: cytidine deaminase [unclassified Halanaerobium]|uniref:cytidine deaminase n=1 Tax=unclassified Halanaerobium TaxID=2641197 RepID=UPI000DF40E0B|nr:MULTISPECIES: cytidine deaminase [unclassified Halanaerobium]RCW45382.1 cytidine deaminase [Halanaerobium sp. MA284_MarDTE_T2]RCW82560.1 cytidine deaminase [Halanaerobium sp. DL-01]
MEKKVKDELFKAALKVQQNAYVPYSNFPLGAAVLTEEGEIYTGVNIENASFGLSNCAERSAIFNAVSHGKKNIKALLLVSSTEKPVTPCGACRQVIKEFSDNIEVVMMTDRGKELIMTSSELLPGAFTEENMEKNDEL